MPLHGKRHAGNSCPASPVRWPTLKRFAMGSPTKSRKIGVKSLGFLCRTHHQPMPCRWPYGVALVACPPVGPGWHPTPNFVPGTTSRPDILIIHPYIQEIHSPHSEYDSTDRDLAASSGGSRPSAPLKSASPQSKMGRSRGPSGCKLGGLVDGLEVNINGVVDVAAIAAGHRDG